MKYIYSLILIIFIISISHCNDQPIYSLCRNCIQTNDCSNQDITSPNVKCISIPLNNNGTFSFDTFPDPCGEFTNYLLIINDSSNTTKSVYYQPPVTLYPNERCFAQRSYNELFCNKCNQYSLGSSKSVPFYFKCGEFDSKTNISSTIKLSIIILVVLLISILLI